MPKIKVIKAFKFAHEGHRVEEFDPSDAPRVTTQEVVDTLKDEGFFEVLPDDTEMASEPDPHAGARMVLQLALDALPGGATDADFVVLNLREQFGELFTVDDEATVRERLTPPSPPTRETLDVALAALPGDHKDADYVVTGMRGFFGELFTADDEAKVRELVKAEDSAPAAKKTTKRA